MIPSVTEIVEERYLKKTCLRDNWYNECQLLGPSIKMIYKQDVKRVVYMGRECEVSVNRIYQCEYNGQTLFITYTISNDGDDCEVQDHPYFEDQLHEDKDLASIDTAGEEYREFINSCFKVLTTDQLKELIPKYVEACDYSIINLARLYKAVYGDLAKEEMIKLVNQNM